MNLLRNGLFILSLGIWLSSCQQSTEFSSSSVLSPSEEVRAALATQIEAWNKGNLNQFVNAFTDSPDATLVSDYGVTEGYENIHQFIAHLFPTPPSMGHATISIDKLTVLSPKNVQVIGKYTITQQNGTFTTGYFTDVFHYTKQGWKIITHHYSPAESSASKIKRGLP